MEINLYEIRVHENEQIIMRFKILSQDAESAILFIYNLLYNPKPEWTFTAHYLQTVKSEGNSPCLVKT